MNWYFNKKKLMLITFGNYMANNRDKDKRLDCCLNLSSFFKPLIKHSDIFVTNSKTHRPDLYATRKNETKLA